MARAMKATKAMKAGGAVTATGTFSAVAEKTGQGCHYQLHGDDCFGAQEEWRLQLNSRLVA